MRAAAVDGFRKSRLPLIESETCLMRGRQDARKPAVQHYRHRYSTRQEGQKVTKLITLAILATVVLLSFACSTGRVVDPKDLILERMLEVNSANYKTQLTADVIPFYLLNRRDVRNAEEYKAVIRSEWDGEKFNLGQDIDKVEQVIKVSAGQAYYLVSGAFDFDEIKEFMEEAGYLPLPYWHERDIYAWQDVRDENIRSVILFPDSNSYYFDEGFPFVERVLKALDEGEGFSDRSDDIIKLLDWSDSSAFTSDVKGYCPLGIHGAGPPNGCLAVAWSASPGDETKTQHSYAGLFDSPENVESYVLEIEAFYDVEITDLEVSENLVTYTIIRTNP